MHRDELEWPQGERYLEEPMDWGGGGGGWEPPPDEPPPPPPPGLRLPWHEPAVDARPPPPTGPIFPDKSPLRGLFVGRFCPPHKGHLRALEEAAQLCGQDNVDLLLRVGPDDPIPASVRSRWFDRVAGSVVLLRREDEARRSSLREALGERSARYRLLFSLDDDQDLAWALGLRFVRLDGLPGLDTLAVERDPIAHWPLLTEPAQGYLRRHVSVVGPEGTGKSELARRLAARHGGLRLDDVRSLVQPGGGPLPPGRLAELVRLSAVLRPGMAPFAGPVLVQDGDVCAFDIESDLRYGGLSARLLDDDLRAPAAHLYLVTDAEPYLGRPDDDDPARREAVRDRWLAALSGRKVAHLLLRGSADERFEQACAALDALLAERHPGAER